MKKMIIATLLLTSPLSYATPATGIAKSHALTGSGNKGMSTPIMCEYYAEIVNNGNNKIQVWVDYVYELEGQKYEEKRYKITVGDGKWHDSLKIQRDVIYKREGNYNLKCKTIIEGITQYEDNATVYIR